MWDTGITSQKNSLKNRVPELELLGKRINAFKVFINTD